MEPSIEKTKLYEKVGRSTFECTAEGISYKGWHFDPECGIRSGGGEVKKDGARKSFKPVNYWKAQALLRGLSVSGRAVDVKRRVVEGSNELSYTLKVVEQRLCTKCIELDDGETVRVANTLKEKLKTNPYGALIAWADETYLQAAKMARLETRQFGNKLYIALTSIAADEEYNRDMIREKTKRKTAAIPAAAATTMTTKESEQEQAVVTKSETDQRYLQLRRNRIITLFNSEFEAGRLNDLHRSHSWNVLGNWVLECTNVNIIRDENNDLGTMILYSMGNNLHMQLWADFWIGSYRGVMRFVDHRNNNTTSNHVLPPEMTPSPAHYQYNVRCRVVNTHTKLSDETTEMQIGRVIFGGASGSLLQACLYLQGDEIKLLGWRKQCLEREYYSKVDETQLHEKFAQLASLKCRPDVAWMGYEQWVT